MSPKYGRQNMILTYQISVSKTPDHYRGYMTTSLYQQTFRKIHYTN